MDNTSRKSFIMYIISGIVICIFLAFIFIYDKQTDARQQQSANAVLEWTDFKAEFRMKKTVITGQIHIDESIGNTLAFYSVHQNVLIYAGTKLIYQYPITNNNPFSESSGYCWNFVNLPYTVNDLQIIISSPYDSGLKNVPKFYIGNALSLPAYIISTNFLQFTLCLIMFILGIVLIVYHVVIAHNLSTNGKLLKLGIFSLFLSIWSANECTLTALLLKNNLITSYLSFLSLMMLALPFAIFVKTFYEDTSKIWNWFCKINVTQIVICLALAFARIKDLKETLWTTHVILGILVCIIFIQSYSLIKNQINTNMVKIHIICVLICVISLTIDLFSYYFLDFGDGNTFGRIGFLAYITILGIASAMESVNLMKMGQEANAYQTLAYTDQMTGLKNRTCFNIDFAKLSENPHDVAVIDFDLNNLKYTNDTYGHSVGDAYIKNCATIIYEIFNGLGSCYRVGGDEFVALIQNSSSIDMTHYLAMLESSVDSSNRNSEHKHLRMQIAYGFAVYSPELDKDLEDTYNRADKIMYNDKKEKKERKKYEK